MQKVARRSWVGLLAVVIVTVTMLLGLPQNAKAAANPPKVIETIVEDLTPFEEASNGNPNVKFLARQPTYDGFKDSSCNDFIGNYPTVEDACNVTNVNYIKQFGATECNPCKS